MTRRKSNGDGSAEKALDLAALSSSVVATQTGEANIASDTYVFWIAQMAQGIEPWGGNLKVRDRQLREFFPQEYILSSAVSSAAVRNATFEYVLKGPPRTVKACQYMLSNANLGMGWEDFIVQFSLDLYNQDSGAYIEFIRAQDDESAPIIGINHLDSARCYQTGNPEQPVIYIDKDSKQHKLKWYQVKAVFEVPAPIESSAGPFLRRQYSVMTRALAAAQIIKDVTTYTGEKVGGRHDRAIHLLRGISADKVRAAMSQGQLNADERGLLRYMIPIMVSSIDPKAEVSHDTIEMASLPDSFDLDVTMKWYIAAVAMALGIDYQELAPLPGGGLGTSQQSEILHMKTRGKGPGMFQKLITRLMNYTILPANVEFSFHEQDLDAESQRVGMAKTRAETRKLQIESSEITAEAARQIAVDQGDLTEELFQYLGGSDVTTDETVEGTAQPNKQPPQVTQRAPKPTQPAPTARPATPSGGGGQGPAVAQKAVQYSDGGWNVTTLNGEVIGHFDSLSEAEAEAYKVISHEGNKWVLYSHDHSKVLGRFNSEAEARNREREINFFKHSVKQADDEVRAGDEGVEADRLELEDTVAEQALRAFNSMKHRLEAAAE